ncbi:MAG TPA: hypothetical protein VFX89_06015 [Gammaproteobacteria bacterium]|nr:hypothetical protein [Gammaproteobacteria bacterium]
MATRRLLSPGATLVVGLAAGLLAQQASATEEFVVYGNAAASRAAPQAYRAEVESYMRSVSAQIKATVDANLKRAATPKLEIATNELQARG